MVFKRKVMALALMAIYLDSGAAFANSPVEQKLIEQAQFWEQRGSDDNAADAWDKLLKLDPSNTDALMSLAMYKAKKGDSNTAQAYLNRLRQQNARTSQIRAVEEAIRRGPSASRSQLDDARKLARQGDAEAAAETYRQLGDPARMHGEAALEYYQVLAGTLSGYKTARQGLARLVKENPGQSRYELAYAQALTYREDSRPEGIALLDKLSRNADVSKAANDSWRQALSWMGLQAANSKYFRRYLEVHPDDRAIQDKFDGLSHPVRTSTDAAPGKPKPAVPKVESMFAKMQTAGFKALDDNDLPAAEKEFQQLIKSHPKDPVGYGGMGLIKMRSEEFIEARKFLEKALSLSSAGGRKNWQQAYDGTSYWALVEEARAAFEDGESEKGIALLRKAIAINPKEPSGLLQLADALQAEKDSVGAEQNYKIVFDMDKTNIQALDGLIGIYEIRKDLAAMQTLQPYMLTRHLAVLANLKAEKLVEQAKAAEAAGNLDLAQRTYEDAVLITPDDAWLRMALARLYLKRGMPAQARALLDVLTEVEKPDAEALFVSATLSALQNLWWEGLMTLERVPQNARKPEMAALQKRLWIRVQIDRMEVLLRKGRNEEVKQILAQVDAAASNDAEFIGTLASWYIKLGDTERGYSLIRAAVENSKQPSANLLLQYAGVLMRMNQDAEVLATMRKVAAMPSLTEDDVTAFKQLQKALSLRYSERSREAGDYAGAYTYLQPLLIEQPEDNLLLLSLARIYASAGDTEQAQILYEKVLATDPDNPEVLQGLVYSAIQMKDFSNAEKYLDQLMRQEPDNPRYIALAGNVARAQGQNSKALGYFKKALAMEQAQRPLAGRGVNGLRLVDSGPTAAQVNDYTVNPFIGRNGKAAAPIPAPVLRTVSQAAIAPQPQQNPQVPSLPAALSKPAVTLVPAAAGNGPAAAGGLSGGAAVQVIVPSLPASAGKPAGATTPTTGTTGTTGTGGVPGAIGSGSAAQPLPVNTVPPTQSALPGSTNGVSDPNNIYLPAGAAANAGTEASGNSANSYKNTSSTYSNAQAAQPVSPNQTPSGYLAGYQAGYQAANQAANQSAAQTAAQAAAQSANQPLRSAYPAAQSGTLNRAATAAAGQKLAQSGNQTGRVSAYGSKTQENTQPSPEEAALIKEIDALRELDRSDVAIGLNARARSGQSGLSQLKDIETPIEAHLSTLGMGQFGLKIIPVQIDAGTLNLNDSNVAGQFGKNTIINERAKFASQSFTSVAQARGLSNVASIDQVAKGVALNISWELSGFKADIGSSPLNFPIQNVVGGLRWSGQADGINFSAELARRSVTDSYLSYAGAKDTLYGLSWGGVVKNSLHFDVGYDMDEGGLYGGLGYAQLTGKNVEKNTMLDAGAGAYWRAWKTKDSTLTAGVNLTTMFYNKNLSFFTYGHGGYFSPQSYAALNFPIDFSGRTGRLSYQASAAIGMQHFRNDAAPYYPLTPSDQAQLAAFAAANPTVNIPTYYNGQSYTGIQYKLFGALEYLLTPQLALGGRISVDNSGDFTDASGMLYVRYSFEPRRGPVTFPPVAPKPYFSGN